MKENLFIEIAIHEEIYFESKSYKILCRMTKYLNIL